MYFQYQSRKLFLFILCLFFINAQAGSVVKAGSEENNTILSSTHLVGNDNQVSTKFSGKFNQQLIGSSNGNYFNGLEMNDRVGYARSNTDFSFDVSYGPKEKKKTPRVEAHTTFRLRNKWGGSSEISTDSIISTIGDTTVSDPAAYLQKHIFYTREVWTKIMLGELEVRDDFVQVGLVPFSVGRGIALGSAHKQSGFLGFSPGFSVDQYAPGILFRYDMHPKKIYLDAYFSLLENYHTSYKANNETIRANEILTGGAQTKRGTHSHVYIVALRPKAMLFQRGDKEKLHIEPYFVYQHAPDQKIEFDNDSASHLKSFGIAAEFNWNRFQCGGETGFNTGFQDIRAWDRNQVLLRRGSSGAVEHYYSHVFDAVDLSTQAIASNTNKDIVAASIKNPNKNSYYNGNVLVPVQTNDASGLYNAVNRFRPQQKRKFNGWFAVFDASYDISPKHVVLSWGTGWSSGELTTDRDLNGAGEGTLMNEAHSGFIPMQSVYSGTRLNHLIMISSSTPRFSQQRPWETSVELNKRNTITPVAEKEQINSFVNLYFVGSKLEWFVQSWKKYDVRVCPNVIQYWSPESPFRKDGTQASVSLGTELTVQVSATMFEKLKIEAYTGVFLPGEQYRQMKEDGATINKVAIGNTPAYVFSLGTTFSF